MSNLASTTSSSQTTCECPECAGAVAITRTLIRGEVVRCGDCNAELEVTQTAPITLELAPEVQEDWGE
ncbi:MAG: lysine biosynthesis protein LysW [Phycisphaerales bacterium]|nr:lysine biosynthesis protein LysW [Phycisphaerales bacterium]